MYYPSLKEFLRLSKKATVIPIYKEINADLDTPVLAFLKFQKDDYAFLLESVEGETKIARYSFLGTQPSLVFRSKGKFIKIEYPNQGGRSLRRFVAKNGPLDEIKKIMKEFKGAQIKELPRFYGGMVGYLGYDLVRFFEVLPDKNPDDLKLDDAVFMLADILIVFDHVKHTIKIINNIILTGKNQNLSLSEKTDTYARAVKRIEFLEQYLKRPLADKNEKMNIALSYRQRGSRNIISNFKKSEFCGIVNKAKLAIKKGDIIQVVLSQRFKVGGVKGPFDIYRTLRSLNPSPYMFFLKLKDIILIGSSPEMLVRCEDGVVETRPIAGTRPRGKTEEEDKELEYELLNDNKEKAEHLMLVDLGRNDLGKVCKSGKVVVSNFMNVERYSHVMHLVSEIRGWLNNKYDIYDVLRACFPAGTVTGSPKIRAMEIIDELENLRRGPYAGCVGYFSFSQNMDTCLTIRTIVVKDRVAYIQAGAGIVADSVGGREYLESVNKAKALIEALGHGSSVIKRRKR